MKTVNNRQTVRHRNLIPLKVRQSKLDGWVEKAISDVSKQGVCFLSKVPYSPGSGLEVEIFKNKNKVSAEVIWCQIFDGVSDLEPYFRVGIKYNKS
jgi:hypothetical protein